MGGPDDGHRRDTWEKGGLATCVVVAATSPVKAFEPSSNVRSWQPQQWEVQVLPGSPAQVAQLARAPDQLVRRLMVRVHPCAPFRGSSLAERPVPLAVRGGRAFDSIPAEPISRVCSSMAEQPAYRTGGLRVRISSGALGSPNFLAASLGVSKNGRPLAERRGMGSSPASRCRSPLYPS